jgi:hypothetical protein
VKGFEEFMVHTVTVETYAGEDSWGNTHAAVSAPVPGFLDDKRQLVRAASGDQVVSESTFYTGAEHAAVFAPESLVHLSDRVATVIKCGLADSGPLDLPDHIAVTLT